MRTQFVECNTRKEALNACPWAAYAKKVCSGYMCFESRSDYQQWRWQK